MFNAMSTRLEFGLATDTSKSSRLLSFTVLTSV